MDEERSFRGKINFPLKLLSCDREIELFFKMDKTKKGYNISFRRNSVIRNICCKQRCFLFALYSLSYKLYKGFCLKSFYWLKSKKNTSFLKVEITPKKIFLFC